MFEFNYVKAKSLSEAAALLAANPEAKLLAGGMTLIPTLKQRLAQPSHLIDVGGLPELRGIEMKNGGLAVGAATRHHEVETSAVVRKAIPALAYLAGHIGDPQVRNRGTLGGAVANNDPVADYPAAVLALDATVVTARREIAAADFFQGMFATALAEGEIIVRLLFPVPRRAAYEKFPHPASGYAMTGVFIAETAAGVRVAVTGAGPGVFRWSDAESALAKNLHPAALDGLAVDPNDMNEDIHATREYRANLVKVMAQRAVQKLLARDK
jgi:carbon-monoxide dehydrogenase medium subunit